MKHSAASYLCNIRTRLKRGALSHFLLRLVGTTIVFVSVGACKPGAAPQSGNEIEKLRSEINEVKKELLTVKGELSGLRALLNKSQISDPPVYPATFRPNGSHLDDPFLGPKDAEVIMMAFSDYQCTPCRQFSHKIFPELKKDFIEKDLLKLIFRDFPLASHPHAIDAASLAHCAGEQGFYWEMHTLLFNNPVAVDEADFSQFFTEIKELDHNKLSNCFDKNRYTGEVEADIREGKKIGAKGAPGFFVGRRDNRGTFQGVFIRGAQPYPIFREQIQRMLAK